MLIDKNIIYLVTLVFSILTIFLTGVVIAFIRLMKNYIDLKEGKNKYLDPKELLLRAHAKSQKIIEDATENAKQIILSSESLKTKNLDDIQKKIEAAQNANLKIYKDSVSRVENESINMLQNIPDYIKTLMSSEILTEKDDMLREIRSAHENAKELVVQAYRKADAEIAEYKKVRLDSLDSTIINIVQQISRKVLNKEIDNFEHEKLVMKALEEAKRQNVFSETNLNGEGE